MDLPATKGHANTNRCSVAELGLGGIAGPPPVDDENQQCRGSPVSRPSSRDRKGHRKNFAMVLPATEGPENGTACTVAERGLGGIAGPPPDEIKN